MDSLRVGRTFEPHPPISAGVPETHTFLEPHGFGPEISLPLLDEGLHPLDLFLHL